MAEREGLSLALPKPSKNKHLRADLIRLLYQTFVPPSTSRSGLRGRTSAGIRTSKHTAIADDRLREFKRLDEDFFTEEE